MSSQKLLESRKATNSGYSASVSTTSESGTQITDQLQKEDDEVASFGEVICLLILVSGIIVAIIIFGLCNGFI